MHGDLMRVRACLAAGADPDAEDEKGMTAGALAAEKGHKDIVEELREANRDDFVHRDDGWEVPPTGGFPEEPMSNAEDGPSSKRPKKGKSAQSRRLMLAQEAAEEEEQYEEEEEEEEDDEPDSPPRRGQDERARIMMGKARSIERTEPPEAPIGLRPKTEKEIMGLSGKPKHSLGALFGLAFAHRTGPPPPAEVMLVKVFSHFASEPEETPEGEPDAEPFIVPSELPRALEAAMLGFQANRLPEDDVAQMCEALLTVDEGKLSVAEFIALTKMARRMAGSYDDRAKTPTGTGETLGAVFRRSDTDGSGSLDAAQLRDALSDLGMRDDTMAAASVLQVLEMRPGKGLEIAQYKALVKALKPRAKTPPPETPRKAAADGKGTGETVGAVFRRMDKDGNGTLDLGELTAALTDLGLPLQTPAQSQAMASAMASGKKGLDVKEFKALVKAIKGDGKLKTAIQAVIVAAGTGETVGAVFRRMDKDGNGTLDVMELRAALTDLGLPVNSPTAIEAFSTLQASGTKGLDVKAFKALVKSIKAQSGMPTSAPATPAKSPGLSALSSAEWTRITAASSISAS